MDRHAKDFWCCCSRACGELLWRREYDTGGFANNINLNDNASRKMDLLLEQCWNWNGGVVVFSLG
jgi:hypothetical protein